MERHLAASERAAGARRGLAVFAAFLVPLSAAGYALWIGWNQHLPLIFAPALAAIATRLVRREGFAAVAGSDC